MQVYWELPSKPGKLEGFRLEYRGVSNPDVQGQETFPAHINTHTISHLGQSYWKHSRPGRQSVPTWPCETSSESKTLCFVVQRQQQCMRSSWWPLTETATVCPATASCLWQEEGGLQQQVEYPAAQSEPGAGSIWTEQTSEPVKCVAVFLSWTQL